MTRSSSKATINTGNVLNLIDIKKKAVQNVYEELSESIKLTLSEWSSQNNSLSLDNGLPQYQHSNYMLVSTSTEPSAAILNVTRPYDDVRKKMEGEERKNLKIGVKIFMNEDSTQAINECMTNLFNGLHTDHIDNIILAYNPEATHNSESMDTSLKKKGSKLEQPITPNLPQSTHTIAELEGETEADTKNCEKVLPGLKVLWSVLENYVKEGRVYQLGVSDISGGCLRKLHGWAKVRPSIAQINLASCCVVPPSLQQFCRANDVQLLTHADPPDLLSLSAVKTITEAGIECKSLDWCARYQVHIKCRGVLALKGYICKATLVDKGKCSKH